MSKPANRKIEKKEKKDRRESNVPGFLGHLLGGGFLLNAKTQRQIPFLFFLVLLAVAYIANSYYAEKNIRKIESLQKEIKELRFEYVSAKSMLMQGSRQSAIARRLQNTGILEATEPPEKIMVDNSME
ncbi:MAG: hypothetical protein JXA03_04925 [Bacteroidales bacterium]|nr:hypothetical protein [Bacteroidales bacterium]